ncbi:MAG: hypothetical protein ACTSUE_01525 [Promethearchaeota archaeon]
MKEQDILIRNASVLDPQIGIELERKDISISDGIIVDGGQDVENRRVFDVEGRIVIPGGILGTLQPFLPPSAFPMKFNPEKIRNAAFRSGFTSFIGTGIPPFASLDSAIWFNKIGGLNRIPLLEVGNFQFILGFLKNGITNYAREAVGLLLDLFKAYGISCTHPGIVLKWKRDQFNSNSITSNIPFINMTPEKIITELFELQEKDDLRTGIFLEAGNERLDNSLESYSKLLDSLKQKHEGKRATHPHALILKSVTGMLGSAGLEFDAMQHNIQLFTSMLSDNPFVSAFLDLPSIASRDDVFIENGPSPLQTGEGIISSGIMESEIFTSYFKITGETTRERLLSNWATGMKFLIESPGNLSNQLSVGLKSTLFQEPSTLINNIGSLVSKEYRDSFIRNHAPQSKVDGLIGFLGDKTISLKTFIEMTRCNPASMLGLEKWLGGLHEGQIGDAVVLNMNPDEWESIRSNPEKLHNALVTPFALVKQGIAVFRNGDFINDPTSLGFTFLSELKRNESIYKTVRGNFEKTFLKFYSTHMDTKTVRDNVVYPTIKLPPTDNA